MKVIKIFKVLLTYCIIALLTLLLVKPIRAKTNQVNIYLFWSKGCPHCVSEKAFLQGLLQKNPRLELKDFEISLPENTKLWKEAGEKLNVRIGPTPFTIIGDRHFIGFLSAKTTGKEIEKAAVYALKNGCSDIFENPSGEESCPPEDKNDKDIPETINLPLIGEFKTRNVSLPLLTVVMGALDGFNPCAMWALLFLISLLLGMKDRKRMWILGTAFIVTSAFVYFIFMAAWLNFFLFVGFIVWVRILIALVALGAGGYSLREYFVNKDAACKVSKGQKRQKVFDRLKALTQKQSFLLALAGIILLAFVVNLVELVCSAGLPAVYTQVLTMNNLPSWQYYLYLLGYIFFFMLDDLFVFFIAMTTLKAMGIESKYARFSRLFGGIIMLIIGILLLFKPEWLMFS